MLIQMQKCQRPSFHQHLPSPGFPSIPRVLALALLLSASGCCLVNSSETSSDRFRCKTDDSRERSHLEGVSMQLLEDLAYALTKVTLR